MENFQIDSVEQFDPNDFMSLYNEVQKMGNISFDDNTLSKLFYPVKKDKNLIFSSYRKKTCMVTKYTNEEGELIRSDACMMGNFYAIDIVEQKGSSTKVKISIVFNKSTGKYFEYKGSTKYYEEISERMFESKVNKIKKEVKNLDQVVLEQAKQSQKIIFELQKELNEQKSATEQ